MSSKVVPLRKFNIKPNFNFRFAIGTLKDKPRKDLKRIITSKPGEKPVVKRNVLTTYANGVARTKSNKKVEITNNEVLSTLYENHKIKVLNQAFDNKSNPKLKEVGNLFLKIGHNENRVENAKKCQIILAGMVKNELTKGKFGNNYININGKKIVKRVGILTGQLTDSIDAKYEDLNISKIYGE